VISVVVPLEQPNLIRQYTCAARWLTLRVKSYGMITTVLSRAPFAPPETDRRPSASFHRWCCRKVPF